MNEEYVYVLTENNNDDQFVIAVFKDSNVMLDYVKKHYKRDIGEMYWCSNNISYDGLISELEMYVENRDENLYVEVVENIVWWSFEMVKMYS